MGTAIRQPGSTITSLTCNSVPVEGAVIVASTSADDQCNLPTSTILTKGFLGLCYQAPAASGDTIDIVTAGYYPGVASGAITRNDFLMLAATTGTVKTWTPSAGPGQLIVGQALESVSDGERVGMVIFPGGKTAPVGQVVELVAGVGGSTAGSIAVPSTATDSLAVLPAGADPTTPILGLFLNTVIAGGTALVQISGIGLATTGAAVTRGTYLTANGADGTVKTAAPAGGTNDAVLGTALDTAGGAAVAIRVHIQPGLKQG